MPQTIVEQLPGWARRGANACFACALYFVLAATTIRLTSDGRDVATIWPANAVLLALLVRGKRAHWADMLAAGFAGNALANILTRGSLAAPLLFGLNNLIEVSVAAFALRRKLRSAYLIGEPETLAQFIVWAGLVAPALSSLGGAATASTLFGASFTRSLETWFLSDSLGLLIFTPFWVSVFNGEYVHCFRQRSHLQRLEFLLLHSITAAVAVFVFFGSPKPLLFLLFPPVILVSFRLGRLGTQMSVMVIAVLGALGTMHNLGPVALFSTDHVRQAEYFQFFLAVLLLSCLPMTAGLSARLARTSALTERERELTLDRADLARRALTDPLTGLLNRAGFRLEAEAAISSAGAAPLWLLAIDVDRFKEINDRHGHQAGDRSLVQIASVLRHCVSSDDLVGRLGGDEFLIVSKNKSASEIRTMCDQLVSGVAAASSPSAAQGIVLSISGGAAEACRGADLDDLIHRADDALYQAKAAGRNRFVIAEQQAFAGAKAA